MAKHLTLQEAKDNIAQKRGYPHIGYIQNDDREDVIEEAAELYARSKWDEAVLRTVDNVKIKTLFTFDCEKPKFKP